MRLFRFFILPIVVLSLLAISYLRLTDNYELETLDLRFSLRPAISTTDKVVLIEIGDDTIKNLGQWPIGRNYHTLLVKALSEAGAKIILFDIFFSEGREYDDDLAGAIREAKNVYLPFVFELDTKMKPAFPRAQGYIAKNLEIFSAADKGEGHINILPDIDGKFRRVPLLIRYNDGWHPYISFLAGCDYLGIPVKKVRISPGRYIMCGDIKIPLEESSSMIINFSGRWGKSYKHYSYSDVIQSYLAPMVGQKPILDLGIFKDRICVIGLTAAGTVDLHPNPYEPLYPAFGIHAEILNSMLSRKFITRAPREWNLAILIALAILATLAILKTKPVKGLFILAAISFLFVLFGIILFDIAGIWIDLFYPVILLFVLYMALTLYRYISEWKHRILLEKELGIARSIQESFLPKRIPEIEGLDAAAAIFTARQVGGDLYDFFDFGDKRFGVMIGDVSGKGIPASLFMAMVTGAFKTFAHAEDNTPRGVLKRLNT
ncbi:MAG: CHASE2 domain-containing protein, partial [Candidatus Omnitrophica bacterium]|nr:CHASE2 domain-containing protein [Candidatus Omnitrophota bacterium]